MNIAYKVVGEGDTPLVWIQASANTWSSLGEPNVAVLRGPGAARASADSISAALGFPIVGGSQPPRSGWTTSPGSRRRPEIDCGCPPPGRLGPLAIIFARPMPTARSIVDRNALANSPDARHAWILSRETSWRADDAEPAGPTQTTDGCSSARRSRLGERVGSPGRSDSASAREHGPYRRSQADNAFAASTDRPRSTIVLFAGGAGADGRAERSSWRTGFRTNPQRAARGNRGDPVLGTVQRAGGFERSWKSQTERMTSRTRIATVLFQDSSARPQGHRAG